jgi:hypothetical protein
MTFLLLGGKEVSYASINQGNCLHTSEQEFTQKRHIKIINEDHSITLIEDTDLEEECNTNTGYKERNGSSFFLGKHSLLNTLYCSNSKKFTINTCNKSFKFLPYLSGKSYPIYITQRVLRI